MYSVTRLTKCLLLSTGFYFGSPACALENITLQLNSAHSFEYAGYYAAQEKGYYRDIGLNVKLNEAAPDFDVAEQVLNGQAQFGIGTSALLLARAAAKPVVTLAVIFQHSPYVIYTAQKNGIEMPRDLSGKHIMLEPQADELDAYLTREGALSDHFNRTTPNAQELIDGKLDAISGSVAKHPYYFDSAHFKYRTISPRMTGVDFYGDNLFTSERELADQPQRVHNFTEASLRGWRYAKEHPDEIIDLILRKYAPNGNRELLHFEAAQTIPLLQPELIDIGYSNPRRWQHIAEIYADAGMLPRDFPLDDFIYDPHLGDHTWLYRSMAIVLLLLALITAIAVFFYRINHKRGISFKVLEQINQRERTHNHILQLMATGASLSEILDAIIKSVEAEDKTCLCSILLMDKDGRHLRVGAAPNLPDFYRTAIDGIEIGPNVGSCGATAHFGKRTIVADILTHPSWRNHKGLAAEAGLGSCWSEPILDSNKKVLGTFAIYHHEAHQPSKTEIGLVEHAAHLAEIAIEKTLAKQALQQNNLLLSKISAEVPGIIFQFRLYPDGHSCFPFISEAVRKMYGLAPEDLREDATPFFAFRHPEDAERLAESVHESARNLTRWHIEYRLVLPSQGIRWRLGDAQPEKLDDGSILWHGFITDITDRKNAEMRIRHMAQYDTLTDLPNRALFSDRLQQTFASAKREQTHLALLFMDFDKFKPINDALGHAIGDVLLKRSAARMQGCMRESDTIARIGGDEFVVLLPNTATAHDAMHVAEKLRTAIEKPFEIEGHVLNISTSIGIAMYPQHGEDEIELSKNADLAMYYAKQQGGNTAMVYHNEMQVAGQ